MSSFIFKEYERFKTGNIREEDEKLCWTHPVVAGGKLFLRDQEISSVTTSRRSDFREPLGFS